MYIRVVSLHSEASVCREREDGEGKGKGKGREGERGRKRERESVCVAVAGLQELAGADLGVVLCESDKGFKGL